MKHEYFAAIDIGTNAGRLLIGYVIPHKNRLSIKKALLTRLPLRLGEEVFDTGSISEKKEAKFLHAIHAFKHLMEAYDIKHYRAVATSAMREAENNDIIVSKIKKECGIKLEIIDGEEEANLIFSTFLSQKLDHSKSYLFIDVGGGSTELTIIKDGKRIKSKSFKLGTLRLKSGKVDQNVWGYIQKWVKKNCDTSLDMQAIGTGGNANRLVKIRNKKHLEPITLSEIEETRNYVAQYSIDERIVKLRLKPDRADVIIPAADIYTRIMRMSGMDTMVVPKMGLADGIILNLYETKKG